MAGELTRDQRKEAIDMARGLLMAQSQGRPYHNLRTMLESNAMIAIPHAEKVEMLKQYARMENEDPYKTTINTSIPPARVAAGVVGNTLVGGLGAVAMGGAFDLLRDPSVLHGPGAKQLGLAGTLKAYAAFRRNPLILAGILGAGVSGVSAVRRAKADRTYDNNIRASLRSIREEKDPNPYINALLMSNNLHLDALKAHKAKILAHRKEMGEAIPAMSPFMINAAPQLFNQDDHLVIRGAFGDL
jgi:hypothetical protein